MCIRMCIHVCVRVLPGILIDLYVGCMIQILNSFKRWAHNAGGGNKHLGLFKEIESMCSFNVYMCRYDLDERKQENTEMTSKLTLQVTHCIYS